MGGGPAAVPLKGNPLASSPHASAVPGKGERPPILHLSIGTHARICSVCALSFLGSCPTPALGSSPTLLSRALISCWLAVDRRKLLICPFNGSSTSTSMS